MADGSYGGPNRNCYNCGLYGHFARWCPYPPRNNGYNGSPRGEGFGAPSTGANVVPTRSEGFIQGRPILPPPQPSQVHIQPIPNQQAPGQPAQRFEAPPPPLLHAPPVMPIASNAIIRYQPPQNAFPHQQPRSGTNGNGPRGWSNRPRDIGGEGEGLMILREIWNERREERERRRDEEDRRVREEQARLAREEEERRLEQEAKREADREARLACIVREQMEEIEAKKQGGSADISKRNWDKIDPPAKDGENSKGGENGESKKRDQGTMAVNSENPHQLGTGRPRVDVVPTPLDAGLIRMDIDSVRKAQEAQAAMFHQMLCCLEAIRKQGEGSFAAAGHNAQDPVQSHPPPPAQAPPPAPPANPPAPHPPAPPVNPPTPQPPPPPPPPSFHAPASPTSPLLTRAAPSAPSRRVPVTEPGPSRSRSERNDTPTGGGFSARLARMFSSIVGNGMRRRSHGISINEPVKT
ncbi:hypothetical protein CBR_g84876 [Chara braunii]|uniref:CCHC-type domain-containing protein n=1 Tax=Chara braunii TaxID=69332 RepID=A0A388KB84_CHABU|nr:hypothetical protein CBR_g84876 [Chara braunii]|eukprot:GBG67213.1 hypothetical protein CBR_g84876 [Chara braunii]